MTMVNHPHRSKQQQAKHPTDWAMELLAAHDENERLKALNAELLAALKEARSFLSALVADPCAETLKTVNTAIDKAEGK